MTTVQLAFVCGVLLQTLKLVDFILTPQQKERLDDAVRRGALRLKAVEPVQLGVLLHSRVGLASAMTAMALAAASVLLAQGVNLYEDFGPNWTWSWNFIRQAVWHTFVLGLGTLLVLRAFVKQWSPRLTQLFASTDLRVFLRTAALYFGGFLASVSLIFACGWLLVANQQGSGWVDIAVMVVMILAYLLTLVVAVPAFAAFLAMTAWAVARIGYVGLATTRPIVERVAVYQKGPTEALVLLATVALGIVLLVFRG